MHDDTPDIFTALAPLLRVRPELQQLCRFGAQWQSGHEPEPAGWAPFHIVTHGGCMLDVGERTGIRLGCGDVAVLPHGGPHVIRALSSAAGVCSTIRMQPRLHDALIVKSNVDGEPDTKLICGRLRFEQAHDNMVLATLPALVVLSASDGPETARPIHLVEAMQAELEEDRLGAAYVAAALASSLMVIVLRTHFESALQNQGILALLAGRQTGRALAAMLAQPAHPWTLDELAEQASTSRATLVRLFRKATGAAPIEFLGELRLNLARNRLLSTGTGLAMIAEDVGYQSEASFSRAYRRRFNVAPGADRKDGDVTRRSGR